MSNEMTRRERARQWLLDTYPSAWEADQVKDLVTVLDEVVEAERALIAEYIEGRAAVEWRPGNASNAIHEALRTLAVDIAAGRYVAAEKSESGAK